MDEHPRAANDEVMSQTAKIVRTNLYEQAIDQIFSPAQVKRINAHCKKRGLDRRMVIGGIVEAGLKASCIAKSKL
jgi:hypothetical protein